MTVQMKLNKIPFEQIENGVKTVELRLNDEKRSAIRVGDTVLFTLADSSRSLLCEVTALHRYPSFEELLSTPLLRASGFDGYTVSEAVECMRSYYSAESEKKYGVLGIEIMLK